MIFSFLVTSEFVAFKFDWTPLYVQRDRVNVKDIVGGFAFCYSSPNLLYNIPFLIY